MEIENGSNNQNPQDHQIVPFVHGETAKRQFAENVVTGQVQNPVVGKDGEPLKPLTGATAEAALNTIRRANSSSNVYEMD